MESRKSVKEMGEAVLRGQWLELEWSDVKQRPRKKQFSFGRGRGVGAAPITASRGGSPLPAGFSVPSWSVT